MAEPLTYLGLYSGTLFSGLSVPKVDDTQAWVRTYPSELAL